MGRDGESGLIVMVIIIIYGLLMFVLIYGSKSFLSCERNVVVYFILI